jgi:wyosine [tRNA(Phe)-imidazoG37] synthetase (radical SAM superfamily)
MDASPPPGSSPAAAHLRRAFTLHDRLWRDNRYVYPVVSRRSKGISIGVNLNPDKVCNFDCIYCSVDRTVTPVVRDVDLALLEQELAAMLALAAGGELYRYDPFDKIPPALAHVNDIAFSGDGEPTTCPGFVAACEIAVRLKSAILPPTAQRPPVKLVLITNATMLHRPAVAATLEFLDRHDGEIWAKLDAGTEAYFQAVDRTSIPLSRVLANITDAARRLPLVIQSLFMKVHGIGPDTAEIDAYTRRLTDVLAAGGRIKLVQVYTVARQTTESYAAALNAAELALIAERITQALPTLVVETYD